jgi:hypothetical protein
LIKNINEEELKLIAHKLKTVTDMIIAKGDADKLYWQTANWYADAKESNEFKEVVSMGQSAVKPLYLIIYKSESQGLYEYICAMALDEVLGEGFFNDNSKMDWPTSKELIKIINEKVLKDRQDNQ